MTFGELALWQQALAGALAWPVLSIAIGYGCHRIPVERLRRDRFVLRLAAWEKAGRVYETRLRIKRWKDRLPEAGGFFAGGASKRALGDRSNESLERFAAETRRAEIVHWCLLAAWPLFLLWSGPLIGAAMALYAVAANVPCLLVQRYNRARIERVLKRP